MKHLLIKCGNWTNFQKALSEWRNVPRSDGPSPAQTLFGRRQRGILPTLNDGKNDGDLEAKIKAKNEKRREAMERGNEQRKEMPKLKAGDAVLIQNPLTKRWKEEGTILASRNRGRSYLLETKDGWTKTRNRRYLKPLPPTKGNTEGATRGV
ncbi:Hypothetical predicted protein, partial [Paramuricea clavata]